MYEKCKKKVKNILKGIDKVYTFWYNVTKIRKGEQKMKVYGAKKATEFTKKQIGVIYGMAKNGELKVEKWIISDLYNLADYYGYDDSRTVEDAERKILAILDAVFAKDIEKTQKLLDDYTEKTFNLLSRKNQQRADRTMM